MTQQKIRTLPYGYLMCMATISFAHAAWNCADAADLVEGGHGAGIHAIDNATERGNDERRLEDENERRGER